MAVLRLVRYFYSLLTSIDFRIIILIAVLFQIGLLGQGAFSDSDEYYYLESINAFYSLLNGDFKDFLFHVTSISKYAGKPIIQMIPVAFQTIFMYFFDVPFTSPKSLVIPAFFNVIILGFCFYVFWKIALITFRKKEMAVISLLLYSFLPINYMFTRHILPYHTSLLLFLISWHLILKDHKVSSPKYDILIGILAAWAWTVYLGFYFLPVMIIAIHYWKFRNIKKSIYVISGATLYMIFIELISTIGSNSFFTKLAANVSGDYTNSGVYAEGFSFPFKFAFGVDGVFGWFYLAVIIVSPFLIFINKKKTDGSNQLLYGLLILGAYLTHATLTYFLENKVYYSRLLIMYYPFLMVYLISLIYSIPKEGFLKGLVVLAILLCVSNFATFYHGMHQIVYPRDVLYDFGIGNDFIAKDSYYNESPVYYNYKSPTDSSKYAGSFRLINFGYFLREIDSYAPYSPQNGEKLIFSGLHFKSYEPYMYTDSHPEERKLLKERRYRVKLYEIVN